MQLLIFSRYKILYIYQTVICNISNSYCSCFIVDIIITHQTQILPRVWRFTVNFIASRFMKFVINFFSKTKLFEKAFRELSKHHEFSPHLCRKKKWGNLGQEKSRESNLVEEDCISTLITKLFNGISWP